jgi:hypothetical protein
MRMPRLVSRNIHRHELNEKNQKLLVKAMKVYGEYPSERSYMSHEEMWNLIGNCIRIAQDRAEG